MSWKVRERKCAVLCVKKSQPSLQSFFKKSVNDPPQLPSTSKETENLGQQNDSHQGEIGSTVDSYMCSDSVTRAEIIWCLKVVANKMSLRSCSTIADTFKLMFPDSGIATRFQLGETKCSYVIKHGLAPHFHEVLIDRLKNCEDYVLCFDESLNKVSQKGQMDMVVRYFDCNTNRVANQYYNSAFLDHATSAVLLQSFLSGLRPLVPNNLLQVSMDGPNVNHCFLQNLKEKMDEDSPDGKKNWTLVCVVYMLSMVQSKVVYSQLDGTCTVFFVTYTICFVILQLVVQITLFLLVARCFL
jgi:hypothetical protein